MSALQLQFESALLVDHDNRSVALLSRMVADCGLFDARVVKTGEAALQAVENFTPGIIICEGNLSDMPTADFIRTVRKSENKKLCIVPVIVVTGYTKRAIVESARDAGANLVLKKPVSTAALHKRLAWVARATRNFVEHTNYVGPDRRFNNTDLPGGMMRRASDLKDGAGAQSAPDMTQEEIDTMYEWR
jgi:CheY-like chemotaxis protein